MNEYYSKNEGFTLLEIINFTGFQLVVIVIIKIMADIIVTIVIYSEKAFRG